MAADERLFLRADASIPAPTDFRHVWFGDTLTYPTGRGLEPPQRGWTCSGCGAGWAPWIASCRHCEPRASVAPAPEAGAGCICCPEEG